MNQQILLAVRGGSYAIDAKIIGQLGIHDSPNLYSVVETRVSHIKTGCLIAAFSWYHDALDFAKKANELIDFDTFALVISEQGIKATREQFKAQLDKLKTLRNSYESYIPQSELSLAKMSRNRIKSRMQV